MITDALNLELLLTDWFGLSWLIVIFLFVKLTEKLYLAATINL